MLHIDTEFKNLIPPLTAEEYSGLEASILEEGCRDALVVWGDTLIDGHNRYEICTRHNIPFEITELFFEDRNAAKLWMMKNQLARRNLGDMQRIAIVRKCEDALKEKAKEISLANLKQNTEWEKLPTREISRVNDELGAMAGVSRKTYEHAVEVLDTAPQTIVDAALRDDTGKELRLKGWLIQ